MTTALSFRSRRLLVWSVLALVYVISYFHRIAPAVLAKDLMSSFAATGVEVATMSALYLYAFAAMQFVVGAAVDAWGPRRAVAAGAAVMAAGGALFAAAHVLPVAYGARIIVGIGASVVFIGTIKQVGEWWRPDEWGTWSGLTQVVGNLGGLLAAAPLAFVVSLSGWRATFSGVAMVSLLLAGLCVALVRDRPEDAGFSPPTARGPVPRVSVAEGYRVVFGNRKTWLMFFVFFCQYGTLLSFTGLWAVPWMRDVYGMTPKESAEIVSLVGIGVVFGAPAAGFLSDRILRSRRVPFILFTLVNTAVWACVSVPPAGPLRALLGPLCFLVGLTASCLTLTWVLAREVNPPRFSGIATATVNAGGFLGAAVTQNVLGRILDGHWTGILEHGARRYPAAGYHAAFLVNLGMLGFACVLTFAITETFGKRAPD
ncbi:MAG: MFS transporter [Thermoanaerobaculia bacterium]|nr:MFS transporter [Thermoanaerobaculia bacterium]